MFDLSTALGTRGSMLQLIMDEEMLHLHKYHGTHSYNFLFLLLPIIAFALTLAILISRIEHVQVASIEQPSVLGEEAK